MRNEPMRRNDLPETCFSILPSSGQLIIIRCGERGYYPSEWDTGNREENREIASSHNVRRGITDIQEAAMLAGSMFGWQTPAADPRNYDEQGQPINRCVGTMVPWEEPAEPEDASPDPSEGTEAEVSPESAEE